MTRKERINPILSKHPMRNANPVTAILDATKRSQADRHIVLEHLRPRPNQPRRYYSPTKMSELAESIRQHGILQPLLVRPQEEGFFEIVAGERRYRAAVEVGLREIPVIVRELDEEQAAIAAAVENLQREDLNAFEETEFVLQILSHTLGREVDELPSLLERLRKQVQRNGLSHNVMGQEDLAAIEGTFSQLGKMTWQSFVQNRLPLLRLPLEIQQDLRNGSLEYTKARAIARIKDPDQRAELLQKTHQYQLSLGRIQKEVAQLLHPQAPADLSVRAKNILVNLKQKQLTPLQEQKIQGLLSELEHTLAH